MGNKPTRFPSHWLAFIAARKFSCGTATAIAGECFAQEHGLLARLVQQQGNLAQSHGSGNETSAHVQHDPRMTLMICALEGAPLILRLYGAARVIHHKDPERQGLFSHFKPLPGARQIFDLAIDLVQTSCGMGVPYLSTARERLMLAEWAIKKVMRAYANNGKIKAS